MNLADAVQGGDDNFKIVLNYKGRHTFTQEPCVYAGRQSTVYTIMLGAMDFFVVAPTEAKRADVFGEFDGFLENMLKYTTVERNPYSALLVYNGTGRLEPAFTIDHDGYGKSQAVLLVFGLKGETMALGYSGVNMREKVKLAFQNGTDLFEIRRGNEQLIRGLFGDHELAVMAPPEETGDGGIRDTADTGDSAGRGGTEESENVQEGDA